MTVFDEEVFVEHLVDEFVELQKAGAWDFAIEIEGGPVRGQTDLIDTLARDISYEPITINVEEKNFGSQQVTLPINQERVTLTVTLRDTKEEDIYKWCEAMAAKVIHSDGTFGVPVEYVTRVRIWKNTRKEGNPMEWGMYFTNVGEIAPDRSSKEYLEFPITFTQHSTSNTLITESHSQSTSNPINVPYSSR